MTTVGTFAHRRATLVHVIVTGISLLVITSGWADAEMTIPEFASWRRSHCLATEVERLPEAKIRHILGRLLWVDSGH